MIERLASTETGRAKLLGLRFIELIGPIPAPPLVAAGHLSIELKHILQQALSQVSEGSLQNIFASKYAAVGEENYLALRHVMEETSELDILSVDEQVAHYNT